MYWSETPPPWRPCQCPSCQTFRRRRAEELELARRQETERRLAAEEERWRQALLASIGMRPRATSVGEFQAELRRLQDEGLPPLTPRRGTPVHQGFVAPSPELTPPPGCPISLEHYRLCISCQEAWPPVQGGRSAPLTGAWDEPAAEVEMPAFWNCGTLAGFRRHLDADETPCDACKAAEHADQDVYYANAKYQR